MAYTASPGALIRIGVDGDDEAVRRVNAVGDSMNRLASRVESAFKTLAGTVGIGGGLAGVIQMSDAYTKYTAQVRLATQTQGEYREGLAAIKRIATDSQQELAATGTLYARIANGTRELGISQARVGAITEAVNLSLKVSGATAEESASAQLQLSQAFASGTLRGEEFNAVNEAAPRLMLALAEGIGVPVGALKEMASSGQITSAVMATVLPQALEKLRAEAAQVQTIGGAFTVLKNNVMEFTAEHANANGTVAVLTTSIGLLSSNLTLLFGVIQTVTAAKIGTWLAGWVAQTYAKVVADRTAAASALATANADLVAARAAEALTVARVAELRAAVLAAEGNAILALTTNGLIPAQARAAAASQATTAALVAQTTAQRAASVSSGLAAGALGLVGGPIGLVITLLGLAATAWTIWGRKSEESSEQSAEAVRASTSDIMASLDKQIEKISERNRLAKLGGVTATQDSPATARMGELLAEIEKVNKAEGEYAALDLTGRIGVLQALGREYSELGEKAEKLNRVTAEQTELANKKSLGEWMVTYANNSEKLTAELTKAKKQLGDEFTPELESRIRKSFETKAAGATKEVSAYQTLTAAIKTKTAENELEARAGMNATESQKASIKLDQDLASGKLKLSTDRAAYVRTLLGEQAASEALLKTQKAEKDVHDWINQSTDARVASAAALQVEYAMYGKIGDARDLAMVGIKAEADLEKFLTAARREGKPVSDDMVAKLRAEVAARVDVEQATLAQTKALNYAAQLTNTNRASAAGAIADPRARAQAQLEIDADMWRQRIKLAGDGTEAQRSLQSAYDTWYADQQKRILVEVDVSHAAELLKIIEAVDDAARQAAAGMEASFGRVGAAIGGLTTSLTGYERAQAAIAAQLAAATKDSGGDAGKIQRATAAATAAAAQAQIKSYGDMASAAKGFFKENSAGYKVLASTEKAFRAAEMVMAIEATAKKVLFKETEVTANVALNATKLSGEAATTAASTGLAATEASAWGITAVVKALASLPFPANLAAGAATLAAVVAIGASMLGGMGGGGGADVSKERQEAAGTGSVFGSTSAKSDSIARSIELAAANSSIELTHTAGMLASLKAIENSISGLGNLLVRGSGLTSELPADSNSSAQNLVNNSTFQLAFGGVIGLAFNKLDQALGGFTGKIASKVFGGKVTALDTGVTAKAASLGSIATDGLVAQQFTDIKKSGGWFSKDKYSTQLKALGSEADDQFVKVIINLADSVTEAGKLLGVGGDEFSKHLNSFVVDIGKISTKGMDGKEIQSALETSFSKLGDDMAQYAIVGLDQFQKVGEGYLETLTRVATDYANLDSILASTSTTFGQTGLASIGARERLIGLAGGIDELASQTSSFATNFLTQAEQLAPVEKYVTEQLAAMGRQGITTRDQFKDAVLGLANSGALATEAGAREYAQLLALESAFAKTHAATVDLTKSEQAIADERKDLQTRYNEATMTSVQLAEQARAAISGVNLALYDSTLAAEAAAAAEKTVADQRREIQNRYDNATMTTEQLAKRARDAISDVNLALYDSTLAAEAAAAARKAAAETEKAAAETAKAAAQAAAEAIKAAQQSAAAALSSFGNGLVGIMDQAKKAAAAFRELNNSLLVGELSVLSPEAKYAEAKRQFDSADESNLAAAGKALLEASKAWFGGSAGYATDFAAVMARNSAMAAQKDAEAQATLDFWKNFVASGGFAGVGGIGAHAKGGVASGWSLVGEEGPELVNFTQPGRVYTASQSRSMMSSGGSSVSMEETNALLRAVLLELRADKAQRGAVGTATIKRLETVAEKLDGNKRVAMRNGATV